MTEKRWRKLENFYEKEKFKGFDLIKKENSKKLIITFWFTSYNAKVFVENNEWFDLLVVKCFKPLDKEIWNIIKEYNEVIFVESNYSGQFEKYITDEFGLKFIDVALLCVTTSRHFYI